MNKNLVASTRCNLAQIICSKIEILEGTSSYSCPEEKMNINYTKSHIVLRIKNCVGDRFSTKTAFLERLPCSLCARKKTIAQIEHCNKPFPCDYLVQEARRPAKRLQARAHNSRPISRTNWFVKLKFCLYMLALHILTRMLLRSFSHDCLSQRKTGLEQGGFLGDQTFLSFFLEEGAKPRFTLLWLSSYSR